MKGDLRTQIRDRARDRIDGDKTGLERRQQLELHDLHSAIGVVFNDVVVCCHEEDIDDDAERDEELGEGVKHQHG